MKAVILAGGLGTRISEETCLRPKPMIEIGGKPILWHIMKMYSAHGITDFIICCGYKGYMIKEYFENYALHTKDVQFDFVTGERKELTNETEPWRVTLVDTGAETMTGGRLKLVEKYLDGDDFCMTYGDGVSDVNIGNVIEFHKEEQRLVTLTGVRLAARFGVLDVRDGGLVRSFKEKAQDESAWINGGFFVMKHAALKWIIRDEAFEQGPIETLVNNKEMSAYLHHGFWQPMDTLRDKQYLEELWQKGHAPWKTW